MKVSDLTWGDVVKMSLRDIRVLRGSEAPDAAQMENALTDLNVLLASWSAESLFILESEMPSYALTAGKRTYTIGSGGDFNQDKPIAVTDAFVRNAANVDFDIDVIAMDMMDAIPDKLISRGIPKFLYYDPGETEQTSQLGTVELYPIPYTSALTLFVGRRKTIDGTVDDAAEAIKLMPHYLAMVRYGLALHMWPQYRQGDPPVSLIGMAKASRDIVERLNMTQQALTARSGLEGLLDSGSGHYNIISDD